MVIDYIIKRLCNIDKSLSLLISYSKDGVYSFTVISNIIGNMYMFSSPDVKECIDRICNYIEALDDGDKFKALTRELLEEQFVTN